MQNPAAWMVDNLETPINNERYKPPMNLLPDFATITVFHLFQYIPVTKT